MTGFFRRVPTEPPILKTVETSERWRIIIIELAPKQLLGETWRRHQHQEVTVTVLGGAVGVMTQDGAGIETQFVYLNESGPLNTAHIPTGMWYNLQNVGLIPATMSLLMFGPGANMENPADCEFGTKKIIPKP